VNRSLEKQGKTSGTQSIKFPLYRSGTTPLVLCAPPLSLTTEVGRCGQFGEVKQRFRPGMHFCISTVWSKI